MFNPARLALRQPQVPRQESGLDRALLDLLGQPPGTAIRRGGPLVELSGSASSGKSTLALNLCLAALREEEAAGWIRFGPGFYPLAAAEAGEPLERLLVVRTPDGPGALRAADLLLSCAGAVAVAVVALPPRYRPAESALLRLARLAEKSATLLLFLDEASQESPSLGSPVALRLHVRRVAAADGRWAVQREVLRNKTGRCGPLEALHQEPDRLLPGGTL